ncbi:MAG TPA: aminotransferase class V-fold PLP-dependent enzyme [Pirellulaceae bacterium]|nr:aminotransferase class V-fold PLP-dependent enzyme [Pirellulaceae bacterium]
MTLSLKDQPPANGMADWDRMRGQMPVTKRWSYFDHAAVAPIPQRAFDRISRWAGQALYDGDAVWSEWSGQYEQVRRLAAQILSSGADEIGLVPNTSFGINMVAGGFPWQAGDNVVIPAGEFPSNVYPWMNLADRGVEVRVVPLDGVRVCLNQIVDAMDARTRIVSASWVGYATGYRLNPYELGELVHRRGALFFLDAIQGLGVFPLDLSQGAVDFLAADGHKWLLGPEGAGLFYVKREHLDLLRPLSVGWNSVQQGNDFSRIELRLRQAASRYESGSQNLAGFIGLLGSLETLWEFGLRHDQSAIGERVLQVTDALCERLSAVGATIFSDRSSDDVKSGIVQFELPGRDSVQLRQKLLGRQVVVSCRGGRLRASAHAYNHDDDIAQLCMALKDES